jgi:DNA modification methylase
MTLYYADDSVALHHGDAMAVLREIPSESVHCCVTDPPYELGFMGKKWDSTGIANSVELWSEVLRVLKPGAHLAAFGGTRTYHRMACAIEDSGFEIRDSLMWVFGSGFPKSLNIGKSPLFCQCPSSTARPFCNDESRGPAPQKPSRTSKGLDRTCGEIRCGSDECGQSDCPLDRGSLVGCPKCSHSHGERPRNDPASGLSPEPSQVGARIHSRFDEPLIETPEDNAQEHNLAARSVHPSMKDSERPTGSHAPYPCAIESNCSEKNRLPTAPIARSDASNISAGRHSSDSEAQKMPCSADNQALTHPSTVNYGFALPQCQVCGKPVVKGFGTALKPSHEPIVLARKPLSESAVAANCLKHGAGAINVDGCRVGDTVESWPKSRSYAPGQIQPGGRGITQPTGVMSAGRWPSNVLLSPETATALDAQSGESSSRPLNCIQAARTQIAKGAEKQRIRSDEGFTDSGGASRFFPIFEPEYDDPFFYCAKASGDDRGKDNTHPTVKPLKLMQWLVRLLSREGQTVLDPFCGSGTTAQACVTQGRFCIAIDKELEYVELTKKRATRLTASLPGLAGESDAPLPAYATGDLF